MKKRLFIIIVPLISLALTLAGGFTLLWRFFLFLLVVLLLSYLWTRLSIRNIDSNVKKVSEHYQAGERFEAEFTIYNRSRIPSPLIEVQEETNLPGYENMVTFSLLPNGSHRWKTRIDCKRRGRYSLGTLSATVTDPLGFFPLNRQLGEGISIIIYPETFDLPFFQALPRQGLGPSQRRWLTVETGPNAARVREYINGDNLRHIHWRSTAHTGTLMVKEFDPDRSNYAFKNIWIVLDMHHSSHLGEGEETIDEYSIMAAASIAKNYIDSGKRVGLIASGERTYNFLPEAGNRHLQHILQALALIQATGNIPIDTLLTLESGRFDAGSAVIVITSSDNRGIATPLRRIVNRGSIVTAILLDSLSFGGRTSAANSARRLISNGIHVYAIRQGVEIARALDSRLTSSSTQYIGDKV